VNSWRNELREVAKSKAEREAEEEERRRKRIDEALEVADAGMSQALEGLRFAAELLRDRAQQTNLTEGDGEHCFEVSGGKVVVSLSRETAVLAVQTNDGRPREFDFAKDRHLAPKDVEEYVGRRLIELARAAQKEHPW
jgi:uncharacterized protein YdbL (DUF1318 family)